MFKFAKEQKVFDIGGIKVGGQPGEYPVVLAGTIFYKGHKIVTDAKKGLFDKAAAEEMINKQEEMSDLTGNPCMVQVFAEHEEAIRKYVDFVATVTTSPMLIDSTDYKVRVRGAKYAREVGLAERVVYNSINISVNEDEIEGIRDAKVKAAIVLAFNPKGAGVKDRIDVLLNGGGVAPKGLLDVAKECDIDKILLDVAVLPIGVSAGQALMSTYVMKAKFGYPVGGGVHNAISSLRWLLELKKSREDGKEIFKHVDVAVNVLHVATGSNFILYGPIGMASLVFPVCAIADALVAEAVTWEFKEVQTAEYHPLKKLILGTW